ncbi:MAG: hypothetical protein WC955_02360 [Elusimicrobiota bacterium]
MTKRTSHDPAPYDRVIILTPIWMGQLVSPIRGFIRKHMKSIGKHIFVTTCRSDEENKDTKFGSENVFKEVKTLVEDKLMLTEALSIKLLSSGTKQ